MALKAKCRCGAVLTVEDERADRVVCTGCGARVRLRRPGPVDDGFIRFSCPCGRRLKVPSDQPPSHGKCPECSRIVPVPLSGLAGVESRTEELRPEEATRIDEWAAEHIRKGSRVPKDVGPSTLPPAPVSVVAEPVQSERSEAGLRVCPQCGRPVHLGSGTCRQCGIAVPRR
jgi:hypothetical protein